MNQITERMNTIGMFYKKKYGYKVFKLGLSTNKNCPRSNNPCTFCSQPTFIDDGLNNMKILEQIEYLSQKISHQVICGGFIAYFQSVFFSTSNAVQLSKMFLQADQHPQILESIIAVRPDEITNEFLEILKLFQKPVTIEIGVQSVNDQSLIFLNRGHSHNDNQRAIELLSDHNINYGLHIILGIPNDNVEQTIRWINSLKNIVDVKIHHLAVYKETKLAHLIAPQEIISLARYIPLLSYFISRLRKEITISRLFTSNLYRTQIMLNDFPPNKKIWLNQLLMYLNKYDIYQGARA